MGAINSVARKILVHGHRGARALLPENTIPAFEYAIGVGVDAIELDVGVTRDGVVVVSHDPYLAPPICSGPRAKAFLHELTLAQIREWDCGKLANPSQPRQVAIPGTRMPTLDEVFALGPRGSFDFNIEAKTELAPPPEEFVRLVLAEIRKHGLERRVIFQSFDFRVVRVMKKIAPEIRLAALWEGPDRDFVDIAKEAGTRIVAPAFAQVTPEKVRAAHAAGLEVVPWTANYPKDWDPLIAAEVDAIITDDPAALIEYLVGPAF
jgi:glycerophosphoryl diester phosphodiesterase